jgi:hypothetical protein
VYIGPVIVNAPSVMRSTRPATSSGLAQEPDRRHRGPAAEREPHVLSFAGLDHRRDRLRIADRRDRDAVQALAEDLGDDRHHVLRAARAAVVAVVDQEHRRARVGLAERLRARDRLDERRRMERVLGAALPRDREHAVAHFARGFPSSLARVADDDRRYAGVGRVRVRERRQERRREHAAEALLRPCVGQDVAGRPVLGRVAHHRRDERLPAPRHDRLDLAVQRALENRAGEHARVVHVDVRIRLVAGDDRRVVDELARKVGVVVERHGDRHAGRDAADAMRDLALGIVAVVDHHRAVQVEEHGVAAGAHRRPRSGARASRTFSREALFDGHDSAATGRDDLGAFALREVEVRPRAACWCRGSRSAAAAPYAGPSPWPNDESGVAIGENVFVSCLTSART